MTMSTDFSRWWFDAQAWVQSHATEIALAVCGGLLLYLGLRILRRFVRRAAARRADQSGFATLALRVLARTGHFFLIAVAARLVVGFSNPPAGLYRIVAFAFIIAAAFQVAIWLRELVMAVLRQRVADGYSETLTNALPLINVLVSVALFFVAGIVVLDNLGVNVTGLVAGLGIGGIAIGLAAKGIFEDLFAALAIIFDRPFRKGETVGFDGRTATVERIGLKTTRMRALTGEEVIVSNTNLLNKELLNFAEMPKRRMRLIFGVTYQTPPAKLDAIPQRVQDIVRDHRGQPVHCGLVAMTPSSLDFELHYDDDAASYADAFANRHAIISAIVAAFAADGIGFAHPTQVAYTAAPDGRYVMPYPDDAPKPAG